jgi:hypothetical protein
MQDMQCQMVRDEDSAQLMVTKGMACSFFLDERSLRKSENNMQWNASKEEDEIELEENFQPNPSAREHYQKVGLSRLREGSQSLPPEFMAKNVSRKELFDDERSESSFDYSLAETEAPVSQETASEDGDDSGGESENGDEPLEAVDLLQDQEEQFMVKKLQKSAAEDRERGRQVLEQMARWDSLLDLRIRLQKAIDSGNSIPHGQDYEDLLCDDNLVDKAYITNVSLQLADFFDTLTKLQCVCCLLGSL